MGGAAAGFGVYVHWPYCARICPYCDFNVYRQRRPDTDTLLQAIKTDLAQQAALIGPRRTDSIFLGGGTPSLLQGRAVAALINAIDQLFPLQPDAEITLEANPEHAASFADFVQAGVTRLSLGVQAFRDADLKALGRTHDAATARAAVEAAAATQARVSMDLIYARHAQWLPAWEMELKEALALPLEHLSLYQLTIEAGTAFERAARRGVIKPPVSEEAARFLERTHALCAGAGFAAYEVSNFARGDGARSRHNLIYWRTGEWLGVGPGAHGRLHVDGQRWATKAMDRPLEYQTALACGDRAFTHETLSPLAIAEEQVLMGFRVADGFSASRLHAETGHAVDPALLTRLRDQGLLALTEDRIAPSPSSWTLNDRIALELAGSLSSRSH
jgi:oxygen-independent coproporphyrinogen-3 oxidase